MNTETGQGASGLATPVTAGVGWDNIDFPARSAGAKIPISAILLAHGRLAPLRPGSKRPWLRSLIADASKDPAKIAEWERTKPGCSWGLRIESEELIVLDLERPGKGSVAGGVRMIDWIECENGRRLPHGPGATTQHGGVHLYFRLPEVYRGLFKNWTSVFPGIDVRVMGGLVVIPPSSGRDWIESLDDVALPELPIWFCELMMTERVKLKSTPAVVLPNGKTAPNTTSRSDRERRDKVSLEIVRAHIPDRMWFRLRTSGDFWGLWNKTRRLRDRSNSSYEFALSVYAFLRGLSTDQVTALITAWWAKHRLRGNMERVTRKIVPAAQEATLERVEAFKVQQEEKAAGKTANRILLYLTEHAFSTPGQVAGALSIDRKTANMSMIRLVRSGVLHTSPGGQYSCIPAKPSQTTERKHTDSVTVENVNASRFVTSNPCRKPATSADSPSPAIERHRSSQAIAA